MKHHLGRVIAVAAVAWSAVLAGGASTASAEVVWGCKPGQRPNVCTEDQTTTVFEQDGSSRVVPVSLPSDPPVDCFYVYPTVSNQPGPNASKTMEPEIEGILRLQAARFSQECRVFAPIYRQITVPALLALGAVTSTEARQRPYEDVLEAWRDYMRNHNRGRGVVLIGHSQGTFLLRRLLRTEIDQDPPLRKRLVSALLLGGNVLVREGERRGGDFQNVPACTAASQTGCVVAYSTFNEPPPANPRFGKAPAARDPVSGNPGGPGLEVLCTNPASLAANRDSELGFLLPSKPFPPGFIGLSLMQVFNGSPPSAPTPWLRPRDRYTGRCERSNGANVLMIREVGTSERLSPSPDDTWGLHLVDVNLALGDLQRTVEAQAVAHLRKLGRPRVTLRLRHRRGRDARGRRCARPPVRAGLAGRDRRLVIRADFRRNRRLLARDRRPPFRTVVRSSRLRGGRVVRFGLKAVLRDGRSARRFRRARICS